MKKYFSILFALVAVTCISCTKELDNQNIQPPSSSHVVFKAHVTNNPLSKVTITPNDGDTVFSSAWEDTDKVNLYAMSDTFDEEAQADWNPTSQAFEGDFVASAPAVKESWMYEAKFPYDDDGDIPFGSIREQKGNNYNSAYDIMYGTVDYSNAFLGQDNSGNVFVIPMTRLTGIAYFHITGGSSSDDVLSATLTVKGGNIAAETVAINASGPALVPTNGSNSITINFPSGYRPKADDIKLWFNVLPGTYSELLLTIKTSSKTASITSNKSMTYTAGELNKVVLAGLTWVNYGSHSITWDSAADWSSITNGLELTSDDYTVTITDGTQTAAAVAKANDARVYNGGTAVVAFSGYAMSKIVFNISTQGKTRLAPITASTGTIATQYVGDDTVVWTGKATEVTFAVGATADYGSDGSSKAGQLDFDSIDVETVEDGLSDAGISFASDSYTALSNKAFVAPSLSNPNDVSVIYSSTDTDVATINASTGAITIVNEGETIIKATFAGDATYRAAVASYTLTVADPSIIASSTTPAKAGYADNSTVTFTVDANCTWEAVEGTDGDDIIKSISAVDNTVTVTFNANADESEKTAIVNLNQTGADSSPISVPVTVTQSAKPGAATVDTPLWSEDFTGKSATGTGTQASFTCNTSNVYGGSTVTYSFTDNGSNRTQIYEANNAGGVSPELLIGKTSGTFTVAGIPSGAATGMTLTYYANGNLTINSPTTDVTVDALSTSSNPRTFRVNNSGSAETFTLVFSNTSSSNVRIDNILLKAGSPVAGVSVTTTDATLTETAAGTTATINATLAAINGGNLSNVTSAGFYYKKTEAAGEPERVTVTPAANISKDLTSLETGAEYTFYAFACYNGGSEVLGDELTFTPTKGVTTYEVVFTPTYSSKTFGVTITGDKTGISATYSNSYNSANQMTSGNECTLTISGMDGKKIVGASISAKSNSGGGAGYLTLTSNSVDIATIASSSSPLSFNDAAWNSSYSSSYVDIDLDVTETTIAADQTVILVIHATANSLYFGSLTLQYQ